MKHSKGHARCGSIAEVKAMANHAALKLWYSLSQAVL